MLSHQRSAPSLVTFSLSGLMRRHTCLPGNVFQVLNMSYAASNKVLADTMNRISSPWMAAGTSAAETSNHFVRQTIFVNPAA